MKRAHSPYESAASRNMRMRMGVWKDNPKGGCDFYINTGYELVLSHVQTLPIRWEREVFGHPDKVAWMEHDYLLKMTTRKEFDEIVEECYRINDQLRDTDPNRDRGIYDLLGPLEWPKPVGPGRRKQKEVIRPSLNELPGSNTWQWLERTKIPRPTPLRKSDATTNAAKRKYTASQYLRKIRPHIFARRKALLQAKSEALAVKSTVPLEPNTLAVPTPKGLVLRLATSQSLIEDLPRHDTTSGHGYMYKSRMKTPSPTKAKRESKKVNLENQRANERAGLGGLSPSQYSTSGEFPTSEKASPIMSVALRQGDQPLVRKINLENLPPADNARFATLSLPDEDESRGLSVMRKATMLESMALRRENVFPSRNPSSFEPSPRPGITHSKRTAPENREFVFPTSQFPGMAPSSAGHSTPRGFDPTESFASRTPSPQKSPTGRKKSPKKSPTGKKASPKKAPTARAASPARSVTSRAESPTKESTSYLAGRKYEP